MFSISVNLKDTTKVDHILESSQDFQHFVRWKFMPFIKDDIHVFSQLPGLLGHTVQWYAIISIQ